MPRLRTRAPASDRPTTPFATGRSGLAQLSLVEHALCPLDDKQSLKAPLVYDTGHFRTDKNGHSRWIPVRIISQLGMLATDEFFLWGLLALTFAQPNPTLELWATPHWCLTRLGYLTSDSKGGRQYAHFRAVLRRLAGATYFCKRFYDPIKKEERDRAFGFLKYDLPTSDDSSRAWRIVWDPLFFEYCQIKGGRMNFDLALYRTLDPASRRLFLLLSKIFWRRTTSPRFDVQHLSIHVLGFSPDVPVADLKIKLVRSLEKLLAHQVIRLPAGVSSPKQLYAKKGTGSYSVVLERGHYFDQETPRSPINATTDSPLAEPLLSIGLAPQTVRLVLKRYPENLIQVWTDVTLAAMESKGPKFFRVSPQAFLMDNLKQAAAGRRTPPDWWHELRTRRNERAATHALNEEMVLMEQYRDVYERARRTAFREFLGREVPKEEYQRRVAQIADIYRETMPGTEAVEAACSEADRQFAARFFFPDFHEWLENHRPS